MRRAVANSRRKGYHKKGMDFSLVQKSGTSKILSKGQKYSASSSLRRVSFKDVWSYSGNTKYLDATCLLYKGKRRAHTVDYMNREILDGAVSHSGDVMSENGGTHTIHLDLESMDPAITSCIFVLSAFAGAKLADILSPSISFIDRDTGGNLCAYDLEADDKIPHLTSVIMCKPLVMRSKGLLIIMVLSMRLPISLFDIQVT